MHVLGLVLLALARILRFLINLYTFVVAAAVIVSWVNPDPTNPIVNFLRQVTEPVFSRMRRFLPRAAFQWRIDVTPILVFVLLMAVDTVLVGLLFDLASRFR
jgi:YggT family protein